MPHPAPQPELVLASSSTYRRELLTRLRIPFRIMSTATDESARAGEPPRSLVQRLAAAKTAATAALAPDAWVIGCDQLATSGERVLGKPGGRDACLEQLRHASGRTIDFLTACCVRRLAGGEIHQHIDTTRVRFRALKAEEIARYVDAERPYDCAGGFKCEGLGIALFESIDARDPTALVGLPLIWIAATLRACGYYVP